LRFEQVAFIPIPERYNNKTFVALDYTIGKLSNTFHIRLHGIFSLALLLTYDTTTSATFGLKSLVCSHFPDHSRALHAGNWYYVLRDDRHTMPTCVTMRPHDWGIPLSE
jgi:hypothetical protein